MKKTPWFPSGTKPVRAGVYETRYSQNQADGRRIFFQRWNGKKWCSVCFNAEDAAATKSLSTWNPQPIWRGRTAP